MTDLEIILHEVERMPGCETTKLRFKAMLKTLAGQRVYFAKSELIRPDHLAMARAMNKSGMARCEIAAALEARLGVSNSTAYRIISKALHKPIISGDLFHE